MTLEVEFSGPGSRTYRCELRAFTDESLDESLEAVERNFGRLPRDTKTGYPSFTVYEDGQEIGGG